MGLNPPPFTIYFGKFTHMTFVPLDMKKLHSLSKFWGSFSRITFQLLGENCKILCCFICQSSVFQTKIYKNCRVCERLLSGEGQYSHTKKRNIAAAKEGVKKKIEFVMWSEHWSFSFCQAQLSKNPWLFTIIPANTAVPEFISIFFSINYFIWCKLRG